MSTEVSTEELSEMINEDAQDFVLELSEKLYNGITRRTPVRTGQTRFSWNVSKNSPDYTTVDEGEGLPIKPFSPVTFAKGEYPVVYIANGKPHAEYLEYGTQSMAPFNMITASLAEVQ